MYFFQFVKKWDISNYYSFPISYKFVLSELTYIILGMSMDVLLRYTHRHLFTYSTYRMIDVL